MSTRHIAAEHTRLADLTPVGSSGGASKRFRQKLAADGFTVDEGFRLKPGYLYTVVRAISARVNQNYDGWPSDELKKAYKTFIGKPVFVNHENHDPTKARGVVVASRYVENGMDKYIEVVQEIDAGRFPKLAHEIKTGGLDSVSMGAEAGFTICSYCHNKATDLHDMCEHVQLHKGKTLRKFDRRTGNTEDILVFESCHKISFFELSYVFEPADETAVASKVVVAGKRTASDDDGICDYCGQNYRLGDHADDCGDYLNDADSPLLPDGKGTIDRSGYSDDVSNRDIVHDHIVKKVFQDPDDLHPSDPRVMHERSINEAWRDPDADVFDPREFGASRRTAEDLAVPAPPGTPTIDQSVIDATPVYELTPATELTGHEAPGVPKQSGKYTSDDFKVGDGKKPWERDTAEDDDLKEIEAMIRQAGQCPPGQDCSNLAQGEQITKDSPNNPVNQPSSDPNGTGAAGGAGGNFGKPPAQQSGDNTGGSLKPQTQALQDSLKGLFPDAEIGGWREPDGYNEHSSGSALDFMTTDHGQAKQVMDHAFENGAKFVIWDQKQWNPDGSTSAMPDRGDPTQNHKDHVHINTGSRIATPTDDYEGWKAEHGEEAEAEGTHGIGERHPSWGHKRWLDRQDKLQRKLTGVLYDLVHNGGIPIRSAARTAAPAGRVPRQLRGLVNSWVPLADAPPPDPQQPVFVHYNFPAVKRQKATGQPQPDLWSVEQEEVDPETGKKFHRVRGYTDQLHMSGGPGEDGRIKIRVDRGGAKRALGTGVRNVHAGPVGYLAPQPEQPLPYSKINYDPFRQFDPEAGESNFFFHEDNYHEPVWSAEEMHFSPNAQMHGAQADNWGRDRPPTVVFPTHPDLNASNADTVDPARQKQAGLKTMIRNTALRKTARRRALKLAFGETEAPMAVDTLREEGSAPEDDDDDFEQYVKSPKDLQAPDLSQAQQIDREQEIAGAPTDATGGVPGAAEGGAVPGQAPQQQYMTLQIPMPSEAPQVPQQAAPPVMMQPPADPAAMDPAAQQAPPQQIAASVLDYFDRYYGHRVANWMDAIEDRRAMNPAELADYRRQAVRLSTLENGRELSTTTRNPTKGTANMARNSIANRTKVATAGRRQHFAEGPLVDGGPYGRNNEGEQEEAFISQTPPAEAGDFPTDDAQNISNTEHNLVARVQQGRAQLLRDAQQLASIQQRRAFDEAGGPTAEIVDPRVNTGPEGEKLTGTDFISADPNDGVVPTNPKDASLRAFQAFDGWLNAKTGKSSRRHTEATIKKAAAAFSREAGISPQMLFPALGIVLREARKNDKKATKGAAMRKRSNESLEVAAPDGRVDVEAPVENVTSAEAQASQFDLHDFGDNAGDNVANPDLSTDQNWAPGEASKTSARVKTAGGLLAMRCAEGMIEAGLEPNSRERKYQLAAEFEKMNRGLIQDRVALLERFAAVRQADLRRVASGSSRGAARSPIPAGLGGGTRTAAAGQRLAAHDPSNDSSLFI